MSKATLKRVQKRYPDCTHLDVRIWPDHVKVTAMECGAFAFTDARGIASAEGPTLSAAVEELCRVPTVFAGIRRARATQEPDPPHEHPDPWGLAEEDLWCWEMF